MRHVGQKAAFGHIGDLGRIPGFFQFLVGRFQQGGPFAHPLLQARIDGAQRFDHRLQPPGHDIEGIAENSDFVIGSASQINLYRQVALSQQGGGFRQANHTTGQQGAQEKADTDDQADPQKSHENTVS